MPWYGWLILVVAIAFILPLLFLIGANNKQKQKEKFENDYDKVVEVSEFGRCVLIAFSTYFGWELTYTKNQLEKFAGKSSFNRLDNIYNFLVTRQVIEQVFNVKQKNKTFEEYFKDASFIGKFFFISSGHILYYNDDVYDRDVNYKGELVNLIIKLK